jgi:hypothetical protein
LGDDRCEGRDIRQLVKLGALFNGEGGITSAAKGPLIPYTHSIFHLDTVVVATRTKVRALSDVKIGSSVSYMHLIETTSILTLRFTYRPDNLKSR